SAARLAHGGTARGAGLKYGRSRPRGGTVFSFVPAIVISIDAESFGSNVSALEKQSQRTARRGPRRCIEGPGSSERGVESIPNGALAKDHGETHPHSRQFSSGRGSLYGKGLRDH